MSPRARIAVAIAALTAAALGGALAWRIAHRTATLDTPTITLGARIYAQACAACHGENLEGQADWQRPRPDGTLPAPPHDATGHTWHHPDRVLLAIVREGGGAAAPAGFKSGMPAFAGTLSEQEIRAAIAYIKSQWPPDIRARQARMNGGG